jgi:hypothetical protein
VSIVLLLPAIDLNETVYPFKSTIDSIRKIFCQNAKESLLRTPNYDSTKNERERTSENQEGYIEVEATTSEVFEEIEEETIPEPACCTFCDKYFSCVELTQVRDFGSTQTN